MTTVLSLRKDGWIGTEKIGDEPVGAECRACNPNCPDAPQGCEKCVKESLTEDDLNDSNPDFYQGFLFS